MRKYIVVSVLSALLFFSSVPILTYAETALPDLQAQIDALKNDMIKLKAEIAQIWQRLSSEKTNPTDKSTQVCNFTKSMGYGFSGPDVAYFQTGLVAAGYDIGGDAQGTYGEGTSAAVVRFQTKYSITPITGYLGPKTRIKLNSLSLTGCKYPESFQQIPPPLPPQPEPQPQIQPQPEPQPIINQQIQQTQQQNSCPSFASWKRWDSDGKPYCQKTNNKGERLCSYDMSASEFDYKSASCPSESTSANTCNNNGRCDSWETYSCSDCGSRNDSWASHTWKFSDGQSENSMILNRTDSEYLNFVSGIEKQCLQIVRNKFAWKPGAGDSSSSNWQNFGIPDCSGSANTNTNANTTTTNTTTSGGQREQSWNDKGLRSWIRSDADASRIDSLKTACASVSSGMNIWMPGAGDYSSSDFGMPDPGKCARAAACATDQYFNGSDCVSSSGAGGGTSSMRRCFYPNASKSGQSLGYTVWCESDYYNCHQGDPSGSTVSLDGLSLGAPSSCDSGYSGGSGTTTGGSGTACSSGQYWNGTACVNNTTTSSTTACNNNGTCEYGESSGSCPSDCSGSTSGSSGAGSCSSGQYWNGSACVSSGTTSGSGSGSTMDPAAGCAQVGGTWDSATNYCRMPGSGSSGASGFYSQKLLGAISDALKSIVASLQSKLSQ